MRVLIAGCGDVGGVLAARLLERGHGVFALRRTVAALAPGPRPVAADLTRPETLEAIPEGIDAVVYSAAADGYREAAYRGAYVDGVENLCALLHRRGEPVERFLFVSSTSVYGQDDGGWVDETSPTEPASFSGRLVLEGERRAAAGPWAGVAVRFGGIYGPGRNRLLERVHQGAPCAADPPAYTNRIHRDDCAGVLAFLLEHPHPEAVYLGVDDDPAPQCQVMDWLADRLGVPHPPRAAAGTPARGNKRCRNRRLREAGYRLIYPSYREGYLALARDFRPTGVSPREEG